MVRQVGSELHCHVAGSIASMTVETYQPRNRGSNSKSAGKAAVNQRCSRASEQSDNNEPTTLTHKSGVVSGNSDSAALGKAREVAIAVTVACATMCWLLRLAVATGCCDWLL